MYDDYSEMYRRILLYIMYFNSDIVFLNLMEPDICRIKNFDSVFSRISDHLSEAHAFMFVYSKDVNMYSKKILRLYQDLIPLFDLVLDSYSKAFEGYYEVENPNYVRMHDFIKSERVNYKIDV